MSMFGARKHNILYITVFSFLRMLLLLLIIADLGEMWIFSYDLQGRMILDLKLNPRCPPVRLTHCYPLSVRVRGERAFRDSSKAEQRQRIIALNYNSSLISTSSSIWRKQGSEISRADNMSQPKVCTVLFINRWQ